MAKKKTKAKGTSKKRTSKAKAAKTAKAKRPAKAKASANAVKKKARGFSLSNPGSTANNGKTWKMNQIMFVDESSRG